MGWLRAILRPGSTRKMTVLGTGRGKAIGDVTGRAACKRSGRLWRVFSQPDPGRNGPAWQAADMPSRQHGSPMAGATSSAKSQRGRESKYRYWWRGHLPTRDGGQRCGTPTCRCHGAYQNQSRSRASRCEAPLGNLAFTPPWIMGGRAAEEAPPVTRNSLETSRRSVVGISPMPVAGAFKTLPLVHSVVSTT